ncbi:sulfite oxidase heme-binding subunit YedZ [Sphingorhabdus arenilitoris]|uniref:Sulfite oxidase heme-binding subunit YedZ n=1 Tax=Sphingorhabdus arenilitoris TaxID=1490041 RepID=A0ABV8RE58_9SPHN
MRMVLNNKIFFWAVLAVPGMFLLLRLANGSADFMEATAHSGEWAARWMILAMMIGPFIAVAGLQPWLRWMLERRRALGVAAFIYALFHLYFYMTDMGAWDAIWDEVLLPGIWTGWAALFIMLPIALSSNNLSMRRLKAGWKKLQRLVYPAAVLTLLHWLWVHSSPVEAWIHFTPLMLLYAARIFNFKIPYKAGA